MIITGKLLEKRPEIDLEHPELKLFGMSVSKTKSFLGCKAQYKYYYIDKLPAKEWEFNIFGKFIHEVLEKFHYVLRHNPERKYHEIMKEVYWEILPKYQGGLYPDSLVEAKKIATDYLVQMGERKKNNHLPQFLEEEKGFYIDIDGKILLNGFIDRFQLDQDGIYHVADYKTSKAKNKKYLEKDFFQLQTYAYVVFLNFPNIQKVRTSYILLKGNCEELTKEFSRDEILEIEKKYIEYYSLMTKEVAFKENPSPLCKYCSYLENCVPGAEKVAEIERKAAEWAARKNGYSAIQADKLISSWKS